MVAVSRPQIERASYTEEDLERLSQKGYRYELLMGELHEMAAAGYQHGLYTSRLASRVATFIEDHDLGDSFAAETGFTIQKNPDTVIAPDFAFIIKAHLPASMPRGFGRIIPDIVLETRSPGDTVKEHGLKAIVWQQAGVQEVWALDPMARTLTIYRKGEEIRRLGPDDTLDGCEILPGFSYPLLKLFRETNNHTEE